MKNILSVILLLFYINPFSFFLSSLVRALLPQTLTFDTQVALICLIANSNCIILAVYILIRRAPNGSCNYSKDVRSYMMMTMWEISQKPSYACLLHKWWSACVCVCVCVYISVNNQIQKYKPFTSPLSLNQMIVYFTWEAFEDYASIYDHEVLWF